MNHDQESQHDNISNPAPDTVNDIKPAVPNMPKPSGENTGMSTGKKLLLGTVAAFIFLFGALTAFVYSQPATNGTVRSIVQHVPYPAVLINWEPISMSSYLTERDALMGYYQSSGMELAADQQETIEGDIVNTLVNKVAVQQIADQYGITLDREQVDEMAAQISGGQGEVFEQELEEQFGWTREEFNERVVHSIVLASQVSTHIIESDELQQERKKTAEDALQRIEEGEDFNEVALSVSEGFPSVQGGDIGHVKVLQLPESWRESVTSLEVGQHTDVVEDEQAFFIFQLTERVDAGEDSEVQLSAVVVPKRALQDVVDEYIEESTIWELI